jgi:hypothetical protein
MDDEKREGAAGVTGEGRNHHHEESPAVETAAEPAADKKVEMAADPAVEPAEDVEATAEEAPGQSPAEAIVGAIVSHLAGAVDRIARSVSPRPLASLYELHPEARQSSPRELGFRFIDVEDIRGTAVAGAAQRGEDYLPLPPFRGENWQARWQRIRDANQRLRPLPPIDVVKYDGGYWVMDGHNRVGAALADNMAGLDAMVTELVPLDGRASERPTMLLPYMGEMAELRAAVSGKRPAIAIRRGQSMRARMKRKGATGRQPAGPQVEPRPAHSEKDGGR